jgi:hypothetical protein
MSKGPWKKKRSGQAPLPKQSARRYGERSRKVKAQIRAIVRDMLWNDWYIKIGLAVSGIQLAVTFAYITKSTWATAFSILSAIGKAAFVEAGVWLINRTISHARAIRLHVAWQSVLWGVLFLLMWISIRANLRYEWEKRTEIKFPNGRCEIYRRDGVTCSQWEKINVNGANVGEYLTSDEQSEAWQRGGLIPLLVFASIIIGRIMLSAKDGFEAEEMRRLRESERGFVYRDRKKRDTVTRVKRAESVGLEADL